MSETPEVFDQEYFMRGLASGKSLYTDYRWLPDLTIPMVRAVIRHCGIKPLDDVMDFGAARGYVVKAFHLLGYQAFGVDVSRWAVENCDPDVKPYVSLNDWNWADFDWLIAKDVLEHVPDLQETVAKLLDRCNKGLFVVVPLSPADGAPYEVAAYEKDATHLHRLTLFTWMSVLSRPGWEVEGCCRVEGIKDNYADWPKGNGFLTARRKQSAPA